MADEQDRAEQRDEIELGNDYPPEHPVGVDEYGTTPAEERVDEPIAEQVRREEPDTLGSPDDPDPDPGALVDDPSDERELLASAEPMPEPDPQRAADDLEGTGSRAAEAEAVHVESDKR